MSAKTKRFFKASLIYLLVMGLIILFGQNVLAQEWPYAKAAKGELKGTVTIWDWDPQSFWDPSLEASGFYEDYPEIKVKVEQMGWSDVHDKLSIAVMAGAGLPSGTRIHSNYYRSFVAKDAFEDLTSRLIPMKENFWPISWECLSVGEKIYAVPDLTNMMGMLYRRDILEKAGFASEPEQVSELWPTWDEYIEMGKKILNNLGTYMIAMGPANINLSNIENVVSTGLFDKERKVIFDSPAHIKVAQTLKKIWDDGIAKPYPWDSPQYWSAYSKGEIASLLGYTWVTNKISYNIPETEGLWGLAKVPTFYKGGRRSGISSYDSLAILEQTSDKEKEMVLQAFLYRSASLEGAKTWMRVGWKGNFSCFQRAVVEVAEDPFPALAGQKHYKFYLDIMREENLLPFYCPAGTPKASELWSNALFKILEENAAVEKALQEAAEEARRVLEK